jgi:AcrR family transcriptional regulator
MTEVQEAVARQDVRSGIVAAAARLLREEGAAAVTTRAVAQAAQVQAPTIYRLFGDKDGLLEAVVEHTMATYVSTKADMVRGASATDGDPLEDLRAGWAMQIDFSLANPAVFRLLSEPHRALQSPAVLSGKRVLQARVRRLATAGRLRVGEERAVGLIHAAGVGVIQALLESPPADRDHGLADTLFDAVLRQILTDPVEAADAGPVAAAVALRAAAPGLDMFSAAEKLLLADWLDRLIREP